MTSLSRLTRTDTSVSVSTAEVDNRCAALQASGIGVVLRCS